MDRPTGRGRGRPRLTPPPTPNPAPVPGPRPGSGGLQPPPPTNPSMLPPMYAPPIPSVAAPLIPPAAAVAGAGGMLRPPMVPPSAAPSGNFANDVLSRLPGPQRVEMLNLVSRFKQRQMPIQTFLSLSRNLLGEELYGILARGMSRQAPAPPTAAPITGAMAPASVQRPLGHRTTNAELAPSAAAMAGVDANQIDTASLQDVMQYAGVDLKAEADLIVAEQAYYLESSPALTGQLASNSDARLRPDHWFNMNRLRAIVQAAAQSRGIGEVSEEAMVMLGMALHRRLAGVLADLACIAQHRVDGGRMSFKMRIENDPRKQLWLLEQLKAEQAEQGTQIEQLLSLPAGTISGNPQAAPTTTRATGGGKKADQASAASGAKKVAEDAMIKTRLSNITALNALGVKQKSWMTGPTTNTATASNPTSQTPADAEEGGTDPVRIPLHFSQAPSITPLNDRELTMSWQARSIGLGDLIWYAEHDPHLYRSPLMLYLYSSMVPSPPPQ